MDFATAIFNMITANPSVKILDTEVYGEDARMRIVRALDTIATVTEDYNKIKKVRKLH